MESPKTVTALLQFFILALVLQLVSIYLMVRLQVYMLCNIWRCRWECIYWVYTIIIKQLMNSTAISESSKCIRDFTPIDKIGEGSFSSVYKVKRIADGKVYALKKVKMAVLSPKQKNNALNEVRILASIRSSLILQYRDAFFDDQRKFLCIVMQWANGGDLQQLIKKQSTSQGRPFEEGQIWKAAMDILQGLNLLHEKGILHRDLKTANIFISNNRYKIGDMNVSKVQAEQDLAFTQTGTPYYASPEIWRDQPYGVKADIWSFGCLIYEMCTFHPPFEGQDMESLYKKIKKGKYDPIPQNYSHQLSEFIAYCLSKKVEQRPTAHKLLSLRLVESKCEQYKISHSTHKHQFKLLNAIPFQNINSLSSYLPKSCYDQDKPKKKKITEQTLAMSQQKLNLPIIASGQKEEKAPFKKFSIKSKQKVSPGDKILTMPSQSQSKQLERVNSQKSLLGYYRNQSNSQSQGRIDKLPAINLEEKVSRFRHLSTERKEGRDGESPCKKQLDIIRQLRRKCQVHKNKLKKVNSSAECKVSKRYQVLDTRNEYEYRLTQDEKKNRQDQAFANHLRKMSKRAIKKYSSNQIVSREEKTINKSQICLNLQLQVENHRSIHLKKKGKSYKSKIFI